MALRKALYIGPRGTHKEFAANDTMALGGLIMVGDIAMGTFKVTGLGAASAAGDALAYAQTGASLDGLTITDLLSMDGNRIANVAAATTAGDAIVQGQSGADLAGLNLTDALVMNAEKITGLGAATANGDAIAFGQSGAHVADFEVDGALTADSAVINGILDMTSHRITAVASPSVGTDAANKNYVDTVAQGLESKGSVRVIATANIALTGLQTIDGILLTAGKRVGVVGQTDPAENGIYVAAAGAWARAADLAAASAARSAYFWVQEGTANGDTGWVCISDEGADVVGTDTLEFTQFTGAAALQPGDGLTKVGNVFNVVGAAGILTTVDAIEIELSATPGLEFDAVGDSGKLQVKVDDGIQVTGAGTGVKLDGTTLAKSADGVKVLGLPSLFTVNGTAVDATVTAANFDRLFDGTELNANDLHMHAPPPYTESLFTVGAGGVSLGGLVRVATTGKVVTSDQTTEANSDVIGVAMAAGAADSTVLVATQGTIPYAPGGLTVGSLYYSGAGGVLTDTRPVSGRIIEMGVAVAANKFVLCRQDHGFIG
jgi:hypothetical protein